MDSTLSHIGLILSVLYFMGSTASSDDVSSTNYVDFELKGMFHFSWKWKFSRTNCSTYNREMKTLRNGRLRTELSQFSHWEYEIANPNKIDLNGNLSVLVQAVCNNITMDSLNKTVELAPGDERTAVKNFKCVWYHLEYVKCTWEPGPKTPPNTKYRVLYWIKDKTKEERRYKETEFWDLLETGSTCEPVYPSKDKKTVECQLPFNESIKKGDLIAMVVTDTSKQIKPYIYYNDTYQIAKLKPPEILEAHRTPNNTIYVSWSKSQDFTDLDYELLLAPLSSGPKEHITTSFSHISHPVLPDVTYTVKVRVKISRLLSDIGIWSDWSKEFIIKGKEGEKLTAIILPLIFSILLIIVAVTLLVHMEKLKAIICPQIPDPGRIFSKDLQQWLKTDVPTVYSKPEKEEICPVYLIESPPTVKCV